MKNLSFVLSVLSTVLLTACATTEVALTDICEAEEFSFITIENATSHASMDFYIDGAYLVTVAPGGQYFIENVKAGKHEIEAKESNGFRIWIRDLEINSSCEDIFVALGE
jgi:hypothetical protein